MGKLSEYITRWFVPGPTDCGKWQYTDKTPGCPASSGSFHTVIMETDSIFGLNNSDSWSIWSIVSNNSHLISLSVFGPWNSG